ncbi:hypothetical protein D8674_030109 [Pyrus ussuriensis x Pyrus communis]|uniref:Uncharacterized protein n=1 Tax=Pyrus ussuriensis x Pyrus communis TaxID=2448454 RepID=A0A5N5EUG6_9ROSA|nr:hypothetical protein D8674_030109 [Pyrus ussuriensis x Pyrus communis]
MAIDPSHTTASAASVTATAGAAAPNTPTTRPVRPAVSSPLPPNLYAAQSLQIRTQSPSSSPLASAAANHQGVLYPLASSGRGFIPRPIRPAAAAGGEPPVTVANAGASYPSRPLLNFPSQQPISVHLMRSNYSLAPSPLPPPIRGLPLSSAAPEVAPSSVPDSNGFKDMRDKNKDDNLAVIRGRKVRVTDGASLYVHCRSWLRNGFPEEIQPQYGDAVRSLPKPSPIPMASATLPKKEGGEAEEKGDDNKDEAEEHIERLSTHDLLKRHVKRARKVRARLREERLQRIARYKSRLALLLPPLVEQFRNDLASGN